MIPVVSDSSQITIINIKENTMTASASAKVIPMREKEDAIIAQAMAILAKRMRRSGVALSSPTAVKQYLTLQLAQLEREVFYVLYLDVKNRLIAGEELFSGTLTHTSVYPREVAKAALLHNAASVIFSHNHPSGTPEPSAADHALTKALKISLALVDVRALDHVIVAGTQTLSFAERGFL